MLLGAVKLYGFSHHTGLTTPAAIRAVQGVLTLYAPNATIVGILPGCVQVVFAIQCADIGAALAQLQLLGTESAFGAHVVSILASIAHPAETTSVELTPSQKTSTM